MGAGDRTRMTLEFRTLVRFFLVVGGLVYVAWGLLDGRAVFVAMGVAAVVVGAIGLWREGFGT
jgi:hypothetical protein